MAVRRASHSSSWYSANTQQLDRELSSWLAAATQLPTAARAVICPHAGYSYSGATAAYSFKQIDPSIVKTIFILGPSHHVRLSGCAVSQCHSYETPLGDLTIDRGLTKELLDTGRHRGLPSFYRNEMFPGKFEVMSLEADEDEHSIEMQLPYIAKVMAPAAGNFTIVPVMVGSLSPNSEAKYGKIFAKYLKVNMSIN